LRLSTIWQNIQSLKVSLERLGDLVDTPQESSKEDKSKIPMPKINGDVSFKNIGFNFNQFKTPVLKNINFEIKAGSFIGIIGESGSGKSTLIKLLSRLYPPSKGSIYIDNLDIDKVELYSLRTQIGIVPQEPLLFAGSVKENIALSVPDADVNDIVNASKIAEAHDFIMRMPNGYNSEIGERGANLSGGQRQRIAIARTILSNPNLIILDEATSALDLETEKKVVNNLMKFFNGKTTFFITHRLLSIRNADVIFVMDRGEIVESGNHQDLINLGKKYYQISR
jgi:ATP-binding cassette subfamily B protein